MECKNINFPALKFTSPGIYSYTVKELTLSDINWKTDERVYRVIVTVTAKDDGTLEAVVDYPDGFPKFTNIRNCPPPPPCDVCKYFDCLPFPMHWFAPPQKPEFERIMESTPNTFDMWDKALEYLHNYCNRWRRNYSQERW